MPIDGKKLDSLTGEERRKYILENTVEIEPRKVKEWTLGAEKDLSMETGGILHDVATLVAHGIRPTLENVSNFREWLNKIYEIKHDHQNKIKNN